MEDMSLFLARAQFAFTTSFHILFPTLSIGLSLYLIIFEGLWLKTGKDLYYKLYKFWSKIFALTFGVGVVTGVVLSFEFGSNFSKFCQYCANVVGPLIGYEVLTAFFLEASFLGVMLFGHKKVGNVLHYISTIVVGCGTSLSAFWILAANSWMQTPAGYEFLDGTMQAHNWLEIIFNPSFPYRFFHMLFAAYITSTFVILGVSAAYVAISDALTPQTTQKQLQTESFWVSFKMSLFAAAILSPLQAFVGDMHGLNTLKHQPVKIAAMEGLWETTKGAPLVLFGIPNSTTMKNDYAIEIPKLSSLILTHSWDGEVKGLKDFDPIDRPPVGVVFFSFRIMVLIGVWFIFVTYLGLILMWRNQIVNQKWYLKMCTFSAPLGFVATIAGWFVTEVGRQPWLIYNLLRTRDGVSPMVTVNSLWVSLTVYLLLYGSILVVFVYFMYKIMAQGIKVDWKAPTDLAQIK